MDSKINNRKQLLKEKRKELFKEYDETKKKIREMLSDDFLNASFSLLRELELINIEVEFIDEEMLFLSTLKS